MCAATGLASAPVAAVGVLIGLYGFTISRMDSNDSGVTFNWSWIDIVRLNLIPGVKDNY